MPQQPHGASPHASDERTSDGRDVTTILDADATIRYVSPSIERILGYKPEQLVGQNWFQYVHPDDTAQALPGFGQTTQQPGVVQRNAFNRLDRPCFLAAMRYGAANYCWALVATARWGRNTFPLSQHF